jgi:phage terminase large subunit
MNEFKITITDLQEKFIDSPAFITLFGGAAGGGKSRGLFTKYFLRCMDYPGYKALILRRTFPELKRSLIRTSGEVTPRELGKYHETDHVWKYKTGSTLEFGYCESENDVSKYQSAEYDAIGFDESTHFTEYQITYMISRIRGINDFPKGIDLATNPGNVGHNWHKETIINNCIPFQMANIMIGERKYSCLFIPAKATDNDFLMESDPGYIDRLDALPEKDRKRLRDGDWDIFEGQYFSEFNRDIHVIEPFEIPDWWKKFRAMDYGFDMLAVPYFTVEPNGDLIIYREIYESGLTITQAAKKVLAMTPKEEKITYTVASPDLWKEENQRRSGKLTGKHEVTYMIEAGLKGLRKANNKRIPGWRNLREYLTPIERTDNHGNQYKTARLRIFNTCTNVIRTLPALIHDENDYEDAADEPHELTHMPEAVRYGCMSRLLKSEQKKPDKLKEAAQKAKEEGNMIQHEVIQRVMAVEKQYKRKARNVGDII